MRGEIRAQTCDLLVTYTCLMKRKIPYDCRCYDTSFVKCPFHGMLAVCWLASGPTCHDRQASKQKADVSCRHVLQRCRDTHIHSPAKYNSSERCVHIRPDHILKHKYIFVNGNQRLSPDFTLALRPLHWLKLAVLLFPQWALGRSDCQASVLTICESQ